MLITVTDIIALIGLIIGSSGLILGIMNYLRDRTDVADRPATFQIDTNDLVRYSKDWKKIYAEVKLTTGKIFSSNRIKKKPSWA